MKHSPTTRPDSDRPLAALLGGAVIGALGGLIGLGGAEFRLPLLIGAFRFAALDAVILNKAMSLVVVASTLPLIGSFLGGQLLGFVPSGVLLPVLAVHLLISAAKVWRPR